MSKQLSLIILPLLILAPSAVARKPRFKPEAQPDMSRGCIAITNIKSHRYGPVHAPGFTATLKSSCEKPVSINFKLAYFDDEGTQFADGSQEVTVDAGATYSLRHSADIGYFNRVRLRFTKILSAVISE